MLQIELEEGDGYTICRPSGELDAYTVGQFREALGELAARPKLLIDMSGVTFVDSAGLGALIGGIRRARESGFDHFLTKPADPALIFRLLAACGPPAPC